MKASASIKSIVVRLLLVTVGMFGFGFALVPLYDMFCDITGLNGKTNAEAFIPLADLIDTSREVTVQFVATNNDYMPWEFKPQVFKMKVHPGEEIETTFYAKKPISKGYDGSGDTQRFAKPSSVVFFEDRMFLF